MSNPTESVSGTSRKLTPTAEFVRWLKLVCGLVIIETGVVLFVFESNVLLGLLIMWSMTAIGEAWIQFDAWTRRSLWIISGLLTAICLNLQTDEFSPWYEYTSYLLALPAVIEFAAARGFRRWPWIWLIVTPAIYWQWAEWTDTLFELGVRIVNATVSYAGVQANVPTRIPGIAAAVGLPLITRALVGSFIISRKQRE